MSYINVCKEGLNYFYNETTYISLHYIGIVRGMCEGDWLTEHGCPLARPLDIPSEHVAHASLRGNTWIDYYILMNFTTNNNQTIPNR